MTRQPNVPFQKYINQKTYNEVRHIKMCSSLYQKKGPRCPCAVSNTSVIHRLNRLISEGIVHYMSEDGILLGSPLAVAKAAATLP